MEFGVFIQNYVPTFRRDDDPDAEHHALMEDLEVVEAADRAGFKYVWVDRAPLPRRVLAPVGQRRRARLPGPRHRAHPPRVGHLQPPARRSTTRPRWPSGWPCSTT